MGSLLSLADRMVNYQDVTNTKLMRRAPVIIRLDGNSFSSFTRNLDKPFDEDFFSIMEYTCFKLKEKIHGTKFVYSQSDEISLLLTDWDSINTDSWVDYRLQKILSLSAGLATMYFNQGIQMVLDKHLRKMQSSQIVSEIADASSRYEKWVSKLNTAIFDSRAFNLPLNEVCNYFIWRQGDAIRNAKASLGQAHFSQAELNGKKVDEVCKMVYDQKGIDWNSLPLKQQRGFCLYKDDSVSEDARYKWLVDVNIPLFKEDRLFVIKWLSSKEEVESDGASL